MDEFLVRQLEIFLRAQDVCFIWTAIPKTMDSKLSCHRILRTESLLFNHFVWDIDQMKPLSATVVLSLFTPSFRRSTASSGS